MPFLPARLGRSRAPAPPEQKTSVARRLAALTTAGRPQWTARDFASLAAEGFAKNPVAYRCVRMIAEAELGLALAITGFRETFDACVERVALSRAPRVAVSAVSVGDGVGGWIALAPSAWRLSADDRPSRVQVLGVMPGPVQVDYAAGFAACPPPLTEAVLALAVEAYERRGDPAPTLEAASAWLAPFRRGRL